MNDDQEEKKFKIILCYSFGIIIIIIIIICFSSLICRHLFSSLLFKRHCKEAKVNQTQTCLLNLFMIQQGKIRFAKEKVNVK